MAEMEFHNIAEEWPMLGPDDMVDLAADIKANGLRDPIVTLAGKILDGRNRYVACITAGVEPRYRQFGDLPEDGEDPAAFVASKNDQRRHERAEQVRGRRAARQVVEDSLKAAPERSNREVARETGVHHETVATVRDDLEGRGEIRHVDKRADSKGRKQPAKKPSKPSKPRAKKTPAAEANGAADTERADRLRELRNLAVPEVVALAEEGKVTLDEAEEIARSFSPNAVHSHQEDVAALVAEGKPAAEALEEVRREVERQHDGPTDELGIPVQKHAEQAFAARADFRAALKQVRSLKPVFDALARGPGGTHYLRYLKNLVSMREGKEHQRFACDKLESIEHILKTQQPHCTVCPYCWHKHRGRYVVDCAACLGTGWVTKATWDAAPPDYRASVEKLRRDDA